MAVTLTVRMRWAATSARVMMASLCRLAGVKVRDINNPWT